MALNEELKIIKPEVPMITVTGRTLKPVTNIEVERRILMACSEEMHYPELFSAIGKLISTGLDHKTLIDHADTIEKYVSTDSATMANKSVVSVIEDHLRAYQSQVGSRPPSCLTDAIEGILLQQGKFRRNIVTGRVEINGMEITDIKLNELFRQASKIIKGVTKDRIQNIIGSEFPTDYNPGREFFDQYGDRHPRGVIRQLLDCIKSDTGAGTDYVENFITRWLVGIIESMMGEGVCDFMLVFVGPQNTGKTHFFLNLLPKELQKYFANKSLSALSSDTFKRDLELTACRNFLILDDEMSGKSRRDEKYTKLFLSAPFFTLRAAYGRYDENYKRWAVFCGTTNDSEILHDPTGNRRIIPVKLIAPIDRRINDIDRIDLFMEVYDLWKSGFEWRLSDAEIIKLNASTAEFEPAIIEKELLDKYFDLWVEGDTRKWDLFTLSDILGQIQYFEDAHRLDRWSMKRVLTGKGWKAVHTKVGNRDGRWYKLVFKPGSYTGKS